MDPQIPNDAVVADVGIVHDMEVVDVEVDRDGNLLAKLRLLSLGQLVPAPGDHFDSGGGVAT